MPAAKDLLMMEEGDRSECERILRSRKKGGECGQTG
jgi:hypothetical protein